MGIGINKRYHVRMLINIIGMMVKYLRFKNLGSNTSLEAFCELIFMRSLRSKYFC